MLKRLKAALWGCLVTAAVWGCLVTAAVTSAAFGQNHYMRTTSPEHGWNAVVALKVDGEVTQAFRYNPDHEPLGREYTSEAACKQAYTEDEKLKADVVQLTEAVAKAGAEHPDHKITLETGCMQVDNEPQSF